MIEERRKDEQRSQRKGNEIFRRMFRNRRHSFSRPLTRGRLDSQLNLGAYKCTLRANARLPSEATREESHCVFAILVVLGLSVSLVRRILLYIRLLYACMCVCVRTRCERWTELLPSVGMAARLVKFQCPAQSNYPAKLLEIQIKLESSAGSCSIKFRIFFFCGFYFLLLFATFFLLIILPALNPSLFICYQIA